MKKRLFAAVAFAVILPLAALAADSGLEMSVTDSLGFKIRLADVALMKKGDADSGFKAQTFDCIPLGGGAAQKNLWLAQIDHADFSVAEGGKVAVKAVLQGFGEAVTGSVENASLYYFEGQNADAKGKRSRIPLLETKGVENHSKYETLVDGGRGELNPPMPPAGTDLLYVSSVPPGAPVWIKAFDCPIARMPQWGNYQNIGNTPVQFKIPAGQFAVQVRIPPTLAAELKPSTKLGEDTDPFEHDGWGEVLFDKNANVVQSFTYTVNKQEGKTATLISLFQKKGLKFADVLAAFPKGHNFHFPDKKLEGELLYNEVPKDDIPGIIEALHRGGKVIWHGEKRSFQIELTAEGRGWNLTCPIRPDDKKRKTE